MARDIFHNVVKEALIGEGWIITDDPLVLLNKKEGGIETDLGAEKIIIAEKGLSKIAVEVKSFLNPSPINDFHSALGQYMTYLDVMEMKEIERTMYLAMPFEVYSLLSTKPYFRYIIQKHKIKFILFEAETKTIEEWIE
jgi:XisH protein